MPELKPYDGPRGVIFDIAAMALGTRSGCDGPPQQVYQIRVDLGQLDAGAEILQF
jgi:hypothetical protein